MCYKVAPGDPSPLPCTCHSDIPDRVWSIFRQSQGMLNHDCIIQIIPTIPTIRTVPTISAVRVGSSANSIQVASFAHHKHTQLAQHTFTHKQSYTHHSQTHSHTSKHSFTHRKHIFNQARVITPHCVPLSELLNYCFVPITVLLPSFRK